MQAGATSKVDWAEGTEDCLEVLLLDFDLFPSSVQFLADLLLQRNQVLVCPVAPPLSFQHCPCEGATSVA